MIANYIFFCAGSMGYGKTMFATILSLDKRYKCIFANYPIKGLDKLGKTFTQIKHYSEIEKIQTRKNKEEKGVLIIDEVNVNIPNTGYMSKTNTEMAKFAILSRKANIDIILTGVDFWSMDVRFRRIVHVLFNFRKPHFYGQNIDLRFQKRKQKESEFKKEKTHILVGNYSLKKANLILDNLGIWYDTTATARLL